MPLALAFFAAVLCGAHPAVAGPGPLAIVFNLPAGAALDTLKLYSGESNVQLLYAADDVDHVRTNAVLGSFTPLEALNRMLAGTALSAVQDERTGALVVNRRLAGIDRGATAPPAAGTPGAGPSSNPSDETVRLPQFTVSADGAGRYLPADTVSAARIRGRVLDTPLSINIVTRELLEDLGANSMYEATRYFSGISNGRGSGAGGIMDRQNFRGFESFTKTIDNFSSQLIPSNTGFVAVLEPAFIDRIEVVMGPDTILSPTGSPGGSMNVITKSPQYVPENHVILEVGNYEADKVTIDSTGPLSAGSRWAYRVIADYQDGRTYVPGSIRIWDLGAELSYRPSPDTQFTVKYFGTQWELTGAMADANDNGWEVTDPGSIGGATISGLPPKASGFTYDGWNGNATWSHTFDRVNQLSAQLLTNIADQVSVRLGLMLMNDNNVGDSAYPSASPVETFNNTTGEVIGISAIDPTQLPIVARFNHAINQQAQLQNDYAANLTIGGITLEPVTGFAFQWSRTPPTATLQDNNLPPADLFTGVYDPPKPGIGAYTWSARSRTDATQLQIYALAKLGLYADRVLFLGGVSRTWVNSDSYSYNVQDFSQPPTLVALGGFRDTYLAGVVGKPAPDTSVYCTFSSNAALTNSAGTPLWQFGQQEEFGVKSDFLNQRLSFTAAHFEINQTNIVTPNPAFNVDPAHNPQTFLSDQTNHGFEFNLTGAITRGLSVIASVTEMKYRDPFGRRARNVPDHLANLLLNYRFSEGWLRNAGVFAGAVHVGQTAGENPPSTLTPLGVPKQVGFYVAPWTVFNAGASYRWGSYRFNLNVDNVLDSKFAWEPSSRLSVSPYPGTTFRLTADRKF